MITKSGVPPSQSSNWLDEAGLWGKGYEEEGKWGSGFWWGFGEAEAVRERVSATEDEVLWPCG